MLYHLEISYIWLGMCAKGTKARRCCRFLPVYQRLIFVHFCGKEW